MNGNLLREAGGAGTRGPRQRPTRDRAARIDWSDVADWAALAVSWAFVAFAIATGGAHAAQLAGEGKAAKKESPYFPARSTGRALQYYAASGGVAQPRVQLTASGNLLRFSYRVVDVEQAKALVERNATPYLFAPRSHALLRVPEMEQIGPLRQIGELEVGKNYWMVFSNKGNLVKAGDRVSVIVGTYHIDDLMVE